MSDLAPAPEKFCVDCRWVLIDYKPEFAHCLHPTSKEGKRYLVDGKFHVDDYGYCAIRRKYTPCGPRAKHFEPNWIEAETVMPAFLPAPDAVRGRGFFEKIVAFARTAVGGGG